MSSEKWLPKIQDILNAIKAIQRFTASMDLKTFEANEITVKAVLHDLIVIGEASTHIPEAIKQRYAKLPTVWQTIQKDLPSLVPVLETILERETP